MNKNLVILRCGRSSLHRSWFTGKNGRNWDFVACPFQDIDPEPASTIEPNVKKGQKWLGIHQLLAEWQGWRNYKYIWFPDDDLITNADAVNALFSFSETFDAKISAPSLTENSFYSHEIALRNSNFFARAVTFIEIMMPCLKREFLELSLPLIEHSKSGYGWGMDFVWPVMLDYEDMIVFDAIAVQHTRPIGATRDSELLQQGNREFSEITQKYNAHPIYKTRGGWNHQLEYTSANEQGFLLDYLNGYRYLIERHDHLFRTFVKWQTTTIPDRKFADTFIPNSKNIALGKPATVSSTSEWSRSQIPEEEACGGNDGNIQGGWGFHTSEQEQPWWQVDLLDVFAISAVRIFNRLEFRERCRHVALLGSLDGEQWSTEAQKLDDTLFGGADGNPYIFRLNPTFNARFIRVALVGTGILHLDEIEVFGDPVT